MRRIESFEELKSLASKMLRPGVLTNAAISERDYFPSVEDGKMFCVETNDGLYLLRDRGTHYILNFYVCGSFDQGVLPKRVVCEIAYREKDNGLIDLCKTIETANGPLKKIFERDRLVRDVLGVLDENTASIMPLELVDVLKGNFNKYTGCLTNEKEAKYDFVIGDAKALLEYSVDRSTAEIRHMMVDKSLRGQGLSTKLLKEFNKNTATKKAYVWTNNLAARKAYESAGFKEDGRRSYVFANFDVDGE